MNSLPSSSERLFEVLRVFLRLGVTAFGGPAAHIAQMERELVTRRAWLSRAEFLDLVGAASLIPGPNSTEVAIHVGLRRAGFAGLVVAGVGFIAPAALMTTVLAWCYVRAGRAPDLFGALRAVKPVVVVILLEAVWKLAQTASKTKRLALIGTAAAVATVLGANPLAVLVAAGVAAAAVRTRDGSPRAGSGFGANLAPAFLAAPAAMATVPAALSLSGLFLVFLKIGSVLFGSGYVLLAFLRADLVEGAHWLTEEQLLDAVAIGQLTPGPVFTAATFIGYLLARGTGAAVATVGIFLPAFVFVALSGPLVPRIRRSKVAAAFLDGVNVASLALMAVVTLALARAAVVDRIAVGLAVVSAVLLFRLRVSSAWVIFGAAVVGFLALGAER